jgi:hypothetical protein
MRRGWAAGLLAVVLLAATPVAAEPVKVRLKEGNSRGFLALRAPGGGPIAYGELVQKPVRQAIEDHAIDDGELFPANEALKLRWQLSAWREGHNDCAGL